MKGLIVTSTQQYIDKNCDSKGNIKKQNVDDDFVEGIKRRVSNKELLVVPTDKSGRAAVQKPESYVASMEAHVSDNPVISLSDRASIERNLNGHTI